MAETYQLDKTYWTDADFEMMNWHDCPIHAFSLNDDYHLLLDIDYIFKWVTEGKHFKFWISPCTMIFKNVYDIEFESDYKQPIIDFIDRSNPQKPKNSDYINNDVEYDWSVVMVNAEMSFKSVGFDLFVRSNLSLRGVKNSQLSGEGTYHLKRLTKFFKRRKSNCRDSDHCPVLLELDT